MSLGAQRNSKRAKKLCSHCGTRPALFHTKANPKPRWRKDHDLCETCVKSFYPSPNARKKEKR